MAKQTTGEHLYPNDFWVLDDDLGLASAGDQVARMALEVEPPFSLCVAGKWGSGKTSVLRRAFFTLGGQPLTQPLAMSEKGIEEHYQHDLTKLHWDQRKEKLAQAGFNYPAIDETLAVWFSPWQYQNEENPLIPLILELQAQFSVKMKLKRGIKKINRHGGLAVARLLEHLVDAAATLTTGKNSKLARGVTDSVRSAWQEAEPALTSLSDGQRFHLLFEDAVKELLNVLKKTGQSDKARLIIFIDDLDRCEKEVIVRLLEAIKLYLNSRYCVFILGLDSGAVMEALKKQRELPEDANREYLEKLFQATLSVPLPKPQGITECILRQLRLHHIPSAEEKGITLTIRKKMANDIASLLEPNPRKIKNFLNGLCATWRMHALGDWLAEQPEEHIRLVTLYHYLRQFHQPIWRLLERQPQALRILWKVLQQAAATENLGLQGINEQDQRLLEEFFSRCFSHVLADNAAEDDFDSQTHRNQPLGEAIEHFIQRQDRKCSDEFFVACFCELHPQATDLPPHYLYINQQPQ